MGLRRFLVNLEVKKMVVGDFAIELDTVVIGAGPGGYVAAIRLKKVKEVAIIEKRVFLERCLLKRWMCSI